MRKKEMRRSNVDMSGFGLNCDEILVDEGLLAYKSKRYKSGSVSEYNACSVGHARFVKSLGPVSDLAFKIFAIGKRFLNFKVD